MITIIDVAPQMGYSGYDHLITGNECDDAIGMDFRSWRDLARHVNRLWQDNKPQRCASPPIWVKARVGRHGDIIERNV